MYSPFLVFKIGRRKKKWGCKKNFLKNSHLKFFFQKFWIQKKFFFSFFPNFFKKNDFICQIWIQYDLSFHLMYILDVFEEKIRLSKIFIPNLGKFSLWKYSISACLMEKLDKLECWSLILQTTGDPNFHLRPCIQVLSEK